MKKIILLAALSFSVASMTFACGEEGKKEGEKKSCCSKSAKKSCAGKEEKSCSKSASKSCCKSKKTNEAAAPVATPSQAQ
jgi:hypothetical protein